MLAKFSVQNFKSFNRELTLDLTQTKRYEFNENAVKNNIVNHALIYGPNGVGKSNLAFAIFDIIQNLTDKQTRPGLYQNYLNAESQEESARFQYNFEFGQDKLEYVYTKRSYEDILTEQLSVNGNTVIESSKTASGKPSINIKLKGAENLRTDLSRSSISTLKYIKNNTVLEDDSTNRVIVQFFHFVDSMLHFRSLDDRFYQGFEVGTKDIFEDIIKNKQQVAEFQTFLHRAGIDCELDLMFYKGRDSLAFRFGENLLDFWENCSTGTRALALFYFWLQRMKRTGSSPSFLFVDEFDAYYHRAVSELIVRELLQLDVQTILTTHNTSLMSNDLLRPDCYFEMASDSVKPFSSLTDKDIRVAHNIEKMYKSGLFRP